MKKNVSSVNMVSINLPNNVEELQKLVLNLQEEIKSKDNEIKHKDDRINQLLARLFKQKQEGWSKEEKEHALLFNEVEILLELKDESSDDSTTEVKSHKRNKSGRTKIPDFIPRIVHEIDIDEKDKVCACGDCMVLIGKEAVEKLEITPPKFIAHRYVRLKYACHSCEGSGEEEKSAVRIVPAIPQLIPKAILSFKSLAYIITQKFCDALPLYRISGILERYGFPISRSTLSENLIKVYDKVKPVLDEILGSILSKKVIEIDETYFQVLMEEDRSNTTKSFMWAFLSRQINARPEMYFYYQPTRSAEFLTDWLAEYRGSIITDDWASYNTHFARMDNITHAGCNVHARRKFKEALGSSKKKKHEIGVYGLNVYKKIFKLEKSIQESTNNLDEIVKLRREKILPIMEKMKEHLSGVYPKYTPKSPAAKAISYFLKNYDKLTKFLDNGEIPLHTNGVENTIRNFVVGRKNWLFSGSPRGAEASAGLYTLVLNAKLCGLNPQEYLEALFYEIIHNPDYNSKEWTPQAFAMRKNQILV